MPKLFAVVMFAAAYAASSALVNRVSVYILGFWDPKFIDQPGNVAVADQVLPIFVALATLSFLVGISLQASAVGRVARSVAAWGGALCGLVASLLLFTEPIFRQGGVHQGLAAIAGLIAFWAGPACVALLVFRVLDPRRAGPAF